MTPEEKAKEIVHKMNNVDLNCENESMCMLYPHAIECALIAVDEIIKSHQYHLVDKSLSHPAMNYCQEVKEEIIKLK